MGEIRDDIERGDPLLTTTDNPYNPFTQFDEWFMFDVQKGYNTCGYLDRIMASSHNLGEEEERQATLTAMKEIVKLNLYGVHRIVYRSSFDANNNFIVR